MDKVTNQSAGWKMPILLTLCLLQAANALKGSRLVSGELGGAVTIKCHYAPTSVNRHQRKYWCRLGPPTWICRTIVSTKNYIHLRYHGRVALEDHPRSGLFVVRLSQLSPTDEGYYRCGIGNRNDMLFFSMNLTVSAGSSSTIPTATPDASELTMTSWTTASPMANQQTLGPIWTTERQRTECNKVTPTPGANKKAASTTGRQTPGITRAAVPGSGSWAEGFIGATVPSPESRASKLAVISNATEDHWAWGSSSSETKRVRVDQEEKKTTPKADGPAEETRRIQTASDVTWSVVGTIRPATLNAEKRAWETIQETTSVSKQADLDSIGKATPAANVWTLETTSKEMVTVEGSMERELVPTAGGSGPQVMLSQVPALGPLRPRDEESSMKSSFPEEKSVSQILIPVSVVLPLVMLLPLVLLQRKFWRKKTSQEAERTPQVTLIRMTSFQELSISSHLASCPP
ncbi:PREDICTED: high affinity immunoglobulin alpha and immunoglobulin mu Fc receptor [Elephantulus edwardii]|uniref:high affinity immunoglobulin alpha and immunoglobulin mu Fc receptor n=1 Tax=Elephantulus edwardii TaxID=28737 RepID=UPI0003F0EF1A|nr:PREDICTED: high affinity immunoglobulin alpha and immunoglobulin mu Fc receptor [Elephantulus edwardii]